MPSVSAPIVFYLFKGGSAIEEPTVADVELKLDILHKFMDMSKSAISIEASPNGRYAAILDCHHRILIQVCFSHFINTFTRRRGPLMGG
jgi:hypothetical protein